MKYTFDSREVKPGMGFVALKGEKVDGRDFIPKALANGAAEIIDGLEALQAKALEKRRAFKGKVIGVTGSAGKTTTKEFLKTFLDCPGTAGNFNNHIGLPMTILNAPDDAEFLVLEMGTNHPGEIAALCDIAEPDIGVLVSVGTAHIEFFKTREGIAQEKSELLRRAREFGVAPDACREFACCNLSHVEFVPPAETERAESPVSCPAETERSGSPVSCLAETERSESPVSCPAETERAESPVSCPAETERSGSPVSCPAETERSGSPVSCPAETERSGSPVSCPAETERAIASECPLPGAHNVSNMMLAYTVARRLGVSEATCRERLANFALPGARWHRVVRNAVNFIDDSYNANPDSMIAALDAFAAEPCDGKRVAVLGDMFELGENSLELHRRVFAHAMKLGIPLVIGVGEMSSQCLCNLVYKDLAVLKKKFRLDVSAGDLVLLKGSHGMHLSELLEVL